MSACGEKSNTPEARKAKLESLKKEIAQLQAEASVLEKELNAGAVADMGKTVEIATVKKGLFQSFISIEGVVDANESTIATPKVPGTVVRVLVQPGTTVSAGQVLAQARQYSHFSRQKRIEPTIGVRDYPFRKAKASLGKRCWYRSTVFVGQEPKRSLWRRA